MTKVHRIKLTGAVFLCAFAGKHVESFRSFQATRLPSLPSLSQLFASTSSVVPNPGPTSSIGSIAFLLPSEDSEVRQSKFGQFSPVENPSLLDAATHLSLKAKWFSDDTIKSEIVVIPKDGEVPTGLEEVDILIAMGLTSASDIDFTKSLFGKRAKRDPSSRFRQCQFCLDCENTSGLSSTVGPYDEASPSLTSLLVPWSDAASGRRFLDQMNGLFERWTSDDFTVALMLFLNRFSGSPVGWVKDSADASWEKGPVRNAREFYEMATKCGDCVAKCVQDETCKACLDKLTEIDTRDQALSYRTIVSYESELLKDFSFCILQKNNIFDCNAEIPTIPKVTPLATWRGLPLTNDAARSLLVAHLKDDAAPEGGLDLEVSWKVACGANVAYDQFPSQHQLFYESVNGRDIWYDPVFRVETLDGRDVWCKRHYKVRNGPVPGTFYFSVLDNGVTSNEFWTIVDAAEDLSWIVFHYAGAAAVVGQRYIGGLLCTPDGSLPSEDSRERIWNSFRDAGIQPWELFVVDNDENSKRAIAAGPPPLEFYRKDVLTAKAKKLS